MFALLGSLTPVLLPPSAPLEGRILHWCRSAWSCCRESSPDCSHRLAAGFTSSSEYWSLKGNGVTDSRRGGHSTLHPRHLLRHVLERNLLQADARTHRVHPWDCSPQATHIGAGTPREGRRKPFCTGFQPPATTLPLAGGTGTDRV